LLRARGCRRSRARRARTHFFRAHFWVGTFSVSQPSVSQPSASQPSVSQPSGPFPSTTMPRLFGGSPLSESRNGFADGSIGSEWSRLSRNPPWATDGGRRTAARWNPKHRSQTVFWVLRNHATLRILLRKTPILDPQTSNFSRRSRLIVARSRLSPLAR